MLSLVEQLVHITQIFEPLHLNKALNIRHDLPIMHNFCSIITNALKLIRSLALHHLHHIHPKTHTNGIFLPSLASRYHSKPPPPTLSYSPKYPFAHSIPTRYTAGMITMNNKKATPLALAHILVLPGVYILTHLPLLSLPFFAHLIARRALDPRLSFTIRRFGSGRRTMRDLLQVIDPKSPCHCQLESSISMVSASTSFDENLWILQTTEFVQQIHIKSLKSSSSRGGYTNVVYQLFGA